MKMLQPGDPCPICGLPIKTTDPNKLIFLSAIAWWDEQKTDGDADLCGPSSSKATNADKLRSLPEEDLADIIMCPGVEFGEALCKEIDSDSKNPADCTGCSRAWVRAPYTGWEA